MIIPETHEYLVTQVRQIKVTTTSAKQALMSASLAFDATIKSDKTVREISLKAEKVR